MKVLFVSNEVAPYAKVGGLGDVAGSLPPALSERGVDVAVVMPLHRQCLQPGEGEVVIETLEVEMAGRTITASVLRTSLGESDVPIYFISCPQYFDRPEIYGEGGTDYPDAAERYSFFSRAVQLLPDALGFDADVIHANDWPTGPVPLFASVQDTPRATVYTIHNLGYQGKFPLDQVGPIGVEWDEELLASLVFEGSLNYMAAGIRTTTIVNTVSEGYAREIQTEEFGSGLHQLLAERSADLFGIVNGIDYDLWNPATDQALPAAFSSTDLSGKARCKAALQAEVGLPVAPDIPLVGCVSRMAWQKGLDILADAMEATVDWPMQFVTLGTGEPDLEERYAALAQRYPNAVASVIRYDDAIARRIYAGSDLFAMPSRYEPCGLGQMIAMAYATVPVVYETGGLADTVTEAGPDQNGFVFDVLTRDGLVGALKRAADTYAKPDAWASLVASALACDFSWDDSARRYEELYATALSRAANQDA